MYLVVPRKNESCSVHPVQVFVKLSFCIEQMKTMRVRLASKLLRYERRKTQQDGLKITPDAVQEFTPGRPFQCLAVVCSLIFFFQKSQVRPC